MKALLALFLLGFICTACRRADFHSAGERFVPASDPAFHYSGRWDRTDPARPAASWPGFAVTTDFRGKSLHVRMTDSGNYFNVEVDGRFTRVIGGKRGSRSTYLLANLPDDGIHRVRLQRRNINFNEPTVIEGFIVDEGARLTLPEPSRRKRVEFIGDSYTVAEGNEAVSASLPWEEKYPVTNFAKGYAAVLGETLDAEVSAICRSGSGLLCNWKGERTHPMGERYGWTLMERPTPAWKFDEPAPDLVVISLGLNDFNGLKRPDGTVGAAASAEFREAYRKFIGRILALRPAAKIVALSPYTPWARENIAAVVRDSEGLGSNRVFYAEFDHFPGGYVSDGHPTVETHRKMAAQIHRQLGLLGLTSASGSLRDP